MRPVLVTDKKLLKEVTTELWESVKKLRPELSKETRMQLVLKALITIGDLANPIEAAMVAAQDWCDGQGLNCSLSQRAIGVEVLTRSGSWRTVGYPPSCLHNGMSF